MDTAALTFLGPTALPQGGPQGAQILVTAPERARAFWKAAPPFPHSATAPALEHPATPNLKQAIFQPKPAISTNLTRAKTTDAPNKPHKMATVDPFDSAL